MFPRWRAQAEALADPETAAELLASEVFIVVTSYRIPAETSLAAFTAAIEEAARYPNPVTIVAAVVEMAEQRLAKDLFRRLAPPTRVRLILVRGKPTGKRDALARALRAVARTAPRPDAVVLVQDGDTVLPPGCLARTLPFFRLFPSLAALTTDEDCLVPEGGAADARLAPAALRPAPSADVLAGPVAPADHHHRPDVRLPGGGRDRPQLHRADRQRHAWTTGASAGCALLTGEDKSAAYWLLERGLASLYVPDVQVLTIEQPPAPDLLRASTALMLRWFGNMLRASGRCLALGPAPGRLVRLVVPARPARLDVDAAGRARSPPSCSAVAVTPAFLYAYLLWVMATRLIQSLALLTVRPTISGLYPPLLYYSQLYGALLKTWVLFRLDRQRWTRQNISSRARRSPPAQGRLRAAASLGLHLLALATLVAAVALSTGLAPAARRRPACPTALGSDDEAADRPRSRDPPPACAPAHSDRGRDRRDALFGRRLVDGRAGRRRADHVAPAG